MPVQLYSVGWSFLCQFQIKPQNKQLNVHGEHTFGKVENPPHNFPLTGHLNQIIPVEKWNLYQTYKEERKFCQICCGCEHFHTAFPPTQFCTVAANPGPDVSHQCLEIMSSLGQQKLSVCSGWIPLNSVPLRQKSILGLWVLYHLGKLCVAGNLNHKNAFKSFLW